ncbi:addiction module protein [Anatilimnocola floriformis]|uniref:addiction module protein n=1 Tax=Anatilimnocola floriformis TaxID=2948575 RepID=UPI0036F34E72
MSSLITALGIDRLTAAEQMQLARELLDSLAPEAESPPIPDSQRAELDRRVAAVETKTAKLSTWAEVEARVLARISS